MQSTPNLSGAVIKTCLCVAPEVSPVAAERLQPAVTDLTQIVAIRSRLHMKQLMLVLHVLVTLSLLKEWLLTLFAPAPR